MVNFFLKKSLLDVNKTNEKNLPLILRLGGYAEMVKDIFQIQLKCIQNNLKQMYIIMGQIQVTRREGSC